jgi:galactose mutarotase-like enzyme
MVWGYPMAPWAGCLRRAVRRFAGRSRPLPIDAAPHAIHGTVYRRAWVVDDEGSMATGLGADWPFAGHARQRITLEPDRRRCRLGLHADAAPIPAAIGDHAWFAGPVELDVEPSRQHRLVLTMDLSWSG